MMLPRVALGLAVLAALLLVGSGPGTRLGLWSYQLGLQLLIGAAVLGGGAAVIGLAGLVVPQLRAGGIALSGLALAVGVAVAAVPAYWVQVARSLPRIHDISTDLDNPPAFFAVVPLRGRDTNPVEHGGAAVANAQRGAYPDIGPVVLDLAPSQALARALQAAQAMGWDIVAQDAERGTLEATDTTFWFGFKDDVVVRVTPAEGGSRIDVRSLSRVGVSDVGANARRIRAFLARLRS